MLDSFKDEKKNYIYLEHLKLRKTLPKLKKQLTGKRVVIYGAGSFFQCIKKHYDLSEINFVGVADKNFYIHGSKSLDELILKYYGVAGINIEGITDDKDFSEMFDNLQNVEISALESLSKDQVDYILIGLKNYVPVVESLYEKFKDTNIKIRPLVKKSIITLLKEIS